MEAHFSLSFTNKKITWFCFVHFFEQIDLDPRPDYFPLIILGENYRSLVGIDFLGFLVLPSDPAWQKPGVKTDDSFPPILSIRHKRNTVLLHLVHLSTNFTSTFPWVNKISCTYNEQNLPVDSSTNNFLASSLKN
jgi:hypothetical protein